MEIELTPQEKVKFVEDKTSMLRRACSVETFRGYSSQWTDRVEHTNGDGSIYYTTETSGYTFAEKERPLLDFIKGLAKMSLRKDFARIGEELIADVMIQHPEEAI